MKLQIKSQNLLIKDQRFNEYEEKSKSQREETIAKRVKLRRQKADDSYQFIDIAIMPLLEGDKEEVKEGKRLKSLARNKLLTRLPILLAQVKARNNSNKLKNVVTQILYLLYHHNNINKKRLQQFN